jgi:hypothetical protein
MAVGLEPWLYISRGCCAFVVLIAISILAPVFSRFGTARAVCYKLPRVLSLLFVFLVLLYLGDFAALVVESLSRGKLPDTTASFSETIFILTITIHLEHLTAQEKTSVWYIHFISWLLFYIVELFTAIHLGLRPLSPSPYYQLGIFLATSKALTYTAILVLFFRAYREGYKSLAQSDLENCAAASESDTTEDSGYHADDDTSSLRRAAGVDALGIRIETKEEVKILGGW